MCLPFIVLLGIPHGAIDNVLFFRNVKGKTGFFILVYLFIISLNILLWIYSPMLAYLLFLFLSAFHFGQSQLLNHFLVEKNIHKFLYFLWGLTILSGLIYLNRSEIFQIAENQDFELFYTLHNPRYMRIVFYIALTLTLVVMGWLTYIKEMTGEALLMEILVLVALLAAFFTLPLIIGFTLYFIVLHSFKVIQDIYVTLVSEKMIQSHGQFLRLVIPFTLLTFIGIGLLYAGTEKNIIPVSFGFSFLILVSSITLPHALVMNLFYDQSKTGINEK